MTGESDWRTAEREYSDEVIEGGETIPKLFAEAARRHADGDAQWYKGGVYDRSLSPEVVPAAPDGEFAALTYAELHDVVKHLAAGFRDLGLDAGDRVGIYADTRMEWAQSDIALLSAGAVVTTVYTESSAQQVQYLLDDPGATGVVVENEQLLDTVLSVEDDLDLDWIVVVDELDGHDDREDVLTLAEVHGRGREAFDEDAYESWLDARGPEDLASLIYTSGTTGQPKGVQLTHRNFRSNVNGIRRRFGPRPDKGEGLATIDTHTTTLSFLPLAHVFERTAGHFTLFASGGTVAYAESSDTISEDIQQVKPTIATSVPRVYERIFDRMRQQAAGSPVSERIFEWAVEVGRQYATTGDPSLPLRAKYAVADRLVFSTVRENLGGNIDFFISGGGSLDKRLAELFEGIGLPIFEGYGLTETAPVVSVNPPEDSRAGTLGPPLSNVEVELDGTVVGNEHEQVEGGEIGELLVRGPNVTDGYWNDPEATEDAFTDDWFRTGDIIERTDDDYLVYHDRLKQVLVLDTGKNVAPQPIESAFATSERVDQIMVLGDNRKFIAALVVPDFEALDRWADANDVDLPDDREAMVDDDRVQAWVSEEVDRVNEQFAKHEQIKEFRLVPEEWTPDNDLLTPSMKKKRRNIIDAYDRLVDEIYGEPEADEEEAAAN